MCLKEKIRNYRNQKEQIAKLEAWNAEGRSNAKALLDLIDVTEESIHDVSMRSRLSRIRAQAETYMLRIDQIEDAIKTRNAGRITVLMSTVNYPRPKGPMGLSETQDKSSLTSLSR